MKKIAYILMIIGIALIVSGFTKTAIDNAYKAESERIIHAALYGQEYLDRRELLEGRLKWRHSEKLHAERISEGEFKVYVPKAMYSVKARFAELNKRYLRITLTD